MTGDDEARDEPGTAVDDPSPDPVESVDDAAALTGGSDLPWSVVETEVAWETPYFTAGYDVVERPDGSTNRWYWVDPADVVTVVAKIGDEVVLVDQPDGRLERSLLTVPGGGVEADESFVEAGRRELCEETGFRAGDVEVLTTYYPTAWVRMKQAVVYATDLKPGSPDRDPGEVLDVYTASPDAAIEAVAGHSPTFGPGLASLLVARHAGRV